MQIFAIFFCKGPQKSQARFASQLSAQARYVCIGGAWDAPHSQRRAIPPPAPSHRGICGECIETPAGLMGSALKGRKRIGRRRKQRPERAKAHSPGQSVAAPWVMPIILLQRPERAKAHSPGQSVAAPWVMPIILLQRPERAKAHSPGQSVAAPWVMPIILLQRPERAKAHSPGQSIAAPWVFGSEYYSRLPDTRPFNTHSSNFQKNQNKYPIFT